MENLKYIVKRKEHNLWYTYYVDSQNRKQGELKCYFSDDNGNITNKLHVICNYINNKKNGEFTGFNRDGEIFIKCFYKNSRTDGLMTLFNTKDNYGKFGIGIEVDKKEFYFKYGKLIK